MSQSREISFNLSIILIKHIYDEALASDVNIFLILTPDRFQNLQNWISATLSTIYPSMINLDQLILDDIHIIWIKPWWVCQIIKRFEELKARVHLPLESMYPDSMGNTSFLRSWISFMRETTADERTKLLYDTCIDYLKARDAIPVDSTEHEYRCDQSNGQVAWVVLGIYRNSIDSYIDNLLLQMCCVINAVTLPGETTNQTPDQTPDKTPDKT